MDVVKKGWLWCLVMVMTVCLLSTAMGEEKTYDLGGRTVTLGAYWDMTPSESSRLYPEQMELKETIERKYNCKLAFTTTGDWHSWDATIKIMAMSGEKVADAFCHTIDYIIPSWNYVNLLAPLDEYFDLSDPMWNLEAMEPWQYQGKNYTVSTAQNGMGTCILFNKRICAENGITDTMLYELQENREWTWDKLLELAQKCTRDTDGDGEMDVWGFGAYGCAPVISESFIYANGSSCVTIDDKLTYHYNLDDPAAVEAMEWCRMLANDSGVCYRGPFDWGTWEKMWNRGKIAFYQVYSWEVPNYTLNLEDDEFGMLMIPIGPRMDDYVNAQNVHDGWFIQDCVEDKEAVAAILRDWLYPYDWKEVKDCATSFENVVFDDESLDTIRMIEGRSVLALGEPATWFRNNILWNDFGVNSNISGRVYADTNKAPSQAAFDELVTMFEDMVKE